MDKVKDNSYFSVIRRVVWPIEGHENKKFLPMAAMMFCILLNYSTLRSIKDGFVVTVIGPESISFVKTYVVLPMAILLMVAYVKLCDLLKAENVFYTVTSFFLAYFVLFTFVLYPYPELVHPNPETIDALSIAYPNFKWFIRVVGKWSFAIFYAISELWGSMMLSLLFWQFANQITKTEEAKRFYSMFGMLANLSLPVTALILGYFLSKETQIVSEHLKFTPLLLIMMGSAVVIMLLYRWMNKHVLTDPTLYDPTSKASNKKSKVKLSLMESFKMIFSSKYLGLIALLIICYGVSVNLVEGVWKSKIQQLYPTKEEYTMYMGQFQAWQGVAAILFMIVGSNILRRVSWFTAAMITPLMMLITGIAFFAFIFFDSTIAMYVTGLFASGPLAVAVMIGMIQNILSKATKYSLFDATKNMAYIPLDKDLRTKGQAAVEVIGGRFGKSGGGIIQSTFFILLPTFTFVEATPYFASIFFVIVILWLYAIKGLNKEYQAQISDIKSES
ncbi:Npt1/Npt2 family nucleotide transporter [Candidatus Tisiphia endosymbiont of Ptychoptera albimana]|uniref:Npt1/Npt2 family nucleotide transporter n=1 Tax=Candidatus Tisiphia endosymbiont of Ptychoptera albimana TaxID=3066260 RepID=UPI00312C8157